MTTRKFTPPTPEELRNGPKVYRTTDGRIAKIYAITDTKLYPLCGTLDGGNDEWTLGGLYCLDQNADRNDLHDLDPIEDARDAVNKTARDCAVTHEKGFHGPVYSLVAAVRALDEAEGLE